MTDNNIERLFEVDFRLLGHWEYESGKLDYKIPPDDEQARSRLKSGAALYAFVDGEQVLYIGKTSVSIAQRFIGYKKPGKKQSTNIKCHSGIIERLEKGKVIKILTLNGVTHLRWGEFELNLAAGLEDSLIAELEPPWNGKAGKLLTESEMIEREMLNLPQVDVKNQEANAEPVGHNFTFKLGKVYYRDGFINPPVRLSSEIANHGELMLLHLGLKDADVVTTVINRKANKTGSPRLYGRKQVAKWFQRNFKPGDSVQATIVNPHEIILEIPKAIK